MSKSTIVAAALLLVPVLGGAAPAPDEHEKEGAGDVESLVELMRKDVRAGKADIVAKTMELDAEEAAAFWPVYKKYEEERKALGDERLAIIKDYAENFDSLGADKAKDLLKRSLANDEKASQLATKYADEFLKVLPATTVARFFQVDSRINNLIELELSSEIPLVH